MLQLAIRQLLTRKRQTALTLIGILLGTAAYITISGMMMGFQSFIIDQLVNNDSHVRISAREDYLTPAVIRDAVYSPNDLVHWIRPPSGRKDSPYIEAPSLWYDRLESDSAVLAYTPQLIVQALATVGKISVSVKAIGTETSRQIYVTNIEQYMLHGQFGDIGQSGNRIVIGEGLRKKLGITIPTTIFLSTGRGAAQPFKVIGSFLLGVKTLDDTTVFGSILDLQKLNQTPSRVSDIAIRLNDVTLAGAQALLLSAQGREKVQSWDQANEGIMSVFKTQDIVRNSMTISIILVTGFGIYNILSLAVNHKRREIAILRATGYEPRDIIMLFLSQGLMLGLAGGLIGALIGYMACYFISTIKVSPDRGLGSGTIMVLFDSLIYLRGFMLAFVAAVLASYLPARAAGKLEPIEIIRSEVAN